MRRDRPRSGITLLEVQVALIVLGITLAGICPILIVQSKLLRKFETRAAGAKNLQVIQGQRMVDGVPYATEAAPAPSPSSSLSRTTGSDVSASRRHSRPAPRSRSTLPP